MKARELEQLVGKKWGVLSPLRPSHLGSSFPGSREPSTKTGCYVHIQAQGSQRQTFSVVTGECQDGQVSTTDNSIIDVESRL